MTEYQDLFSVSPAVFWIQLLLSHDHVWQFHPKQNLKKDIKE